MLTLRRIVTQHPFYFLACILFIITASATICLEGKIESFIQLNPVHDRSLDWLFLGVTCLGDGIFSLSVAALILLFRRNYQLAMHIVVAYIVSGLGAQLLKRLWLAPRPRVVIDSSQYKNFISGVSLVGFGSFPSGHTTSAFALATVLALHVGKKGGWQLLLFMLALMVAYSRIYLGQHFLADVTAGATLGTTTGILVYAFVNLRKRSAVESDAGDELVEDTAFASDFAGN